MSLGDWPEIQYATIGDDQVAFAVFGDGPVDLVFFSGLGSHVELAADDPDAVRLLEGLASFSRVIFFNRRGTGLSDGIGRGGLPTWEDWTDDLTAVLDAVGARSASVLAMVDAGPIALQFAATQPDRVESLVVVNSTARFSRDVDYPIGIGSERIDTIVELIGSTWGTVAFVEATNAGVGDSAETARLVARQLRACATPGTAAAQFRYIMETVDARAALPLVDVPTLVLHNRHNVFVPFAHGEAVARAIPQARLVELPDAGATIDGASAAVLVDEVARFLTGQARPPGHHDRVLASILFSDIVGSTSTLAELGDDEWRRVLDRHDRMVRDHLGRFGGREVKTTGDGFLAVFDGPGKAIRCAKAMAAAASAIGVPIRVGIHTGECEVRGDDLSGIAVHVAARVMDFAEASEVIVTSLTAELTRGSELTFESRGEHELRGVGRTWQLLAVSD